MEAKDENLVAIEGTMLMARMSDWEERPIGPDVMVREA